MRDSIEVARAAELLETCRECGMKSLEPGPWIHCRGSMRAWRNFKRQPHHGRVRWRCPRCGQDLGCDVCSGTRARNVLCLKCKTFCNGDVVFRSGLEPIDAGTMISASRNEPEPGRRPEAMAGIDRSLPRGDRN